MSEGDGVELFSEWPATTVVVSGSDRAKFLHNLCTADVLSMAKGDVREAFFTNVKGHVLAHALVICNAETIEAIVFRDDAEDLVAHLDRYLIRDDVTIRESDQRPVLLVGVESPPDAGRWYPMPLVHEWAWVSTEAGAGNPHLEQYPPGNALQFTSLRVASGWPLEGTDFLPGTLPQELSRDAFAISFTKGCYLGQETVARLDALGHVNKQIVLVEGEGVQLGARLWDGDKQVGTVTSAADVGGRRLGIAMVRRGSNDAGTKLRGGTAEVAVLPLPTK